MCVSICQLHTFPWPPIVSMHLRIAIDDPVIYACIDLSVWRTFIGVVSTWLPAQQRSVSTKVVIFHTHLLLLELPPDVLVIQTGPCICIKSYMFFVVYYYGPLLHSLWSIPWRWTSLNKLHIYFAYIYNMININVDDKHIFCIVLLSHCLNCTNYVYTVFSI